VRIGALEVVDAIGGWNTRRGHKASRLASSLVVAIADGRVPIGARLPGERPLATALGVSRATVVEALATLREQGWVITRHGSGSTTRLPRDHEISTTPMSIRPGTNHRNLALAMPAAPVHDVLAGLHTLDEDLRAELVDTGHHPSGLMHLRSRIAELLTAVGLPTVASQLMITTGAMHAFSVALRLLSSSGRRRRVVVESPTYPGALAVLAHQSAHAIGWLTAHEPGTLTTLLNHHRPDAVFLIVDGHNPTGAIRSSPWRDDVASHARRLRVRLIIDHTLRWLDLRDEPGNEPPVATNPSDAIVIGSFGKVIWSGLRVGWLRATPSEVAYLTSLDLGAASIVDQLLLCNLLGHHDRYAAQRRQHLAATRDALVAHLPTDQLRLEHIPQGGVAAWLRLAQCSATELAQHALAEGTVLAPGPLFHVARQGDRHLRLPLTLDPETVPDTVALLSQLAEKSIRRSSM
jgi:DNA-binding transcriptional MocR family regulator